MRIETKAVHAGRRPDEATGAVSQPIYLSTTYEREADGKYPRGFSYSRESNPNRKALEDCLASLEDGKEALVFPSGMAVVTSIVQGLEPGDHVIAPNDVYYGFRKVFSEIFPKWQLVIDYVDMRDLEGLRAAIRTTTRLIWMETPSNPLMHITDLEAVGKIARAANAISVCDSTFATPIQQHPFAWNIDMVMHSTTKYIGGHSDAVGGALITKYDNYLFERARHSQSHGGLVPSPFDCWLILRGIDTLPYRVRAQSESAGCIATFLKEHPKVEAVHYPGLPSHSGYDVAGRQMSGFGGMMSFQIRGNETAAMKVAAAVQIFTRATSLGGAHSLIEHRASVEGPATKAPSNLLRLSIGLEHRDDLIADLDQALGCA